MTEVINVVSTLDKSRYNVNVGDKIFGHYC